MTDKTFSLEGLIQACSNSKLSLYLTDTDIKYGMPQRSCILQGDAKGYTIEINSQTYIIYKDGIEIAEIKA